MVAPGVGGFEAKDLAGAVDGQQGAELPDIAGKRDSASTACLRHNRNDGTSPP